ncbi:MAG: hypothetical protein ABL984_00345 [Pyrinomonadaceae bacterium]
MAIAIDNPHTQAPFVPELVQFPSGPITKPFAITPSDSVDLATGTRAIYVGVAGNVAFMLLDGVSVTVALAAGWHPIAPKRVLATGTTATGILGGI